MLLVVACSGGDESSSSTSTTAQGNDTNINDNSGDAERGDTPASFADGLPSGAGEDFPIAIPEGWLIDIHGRAGLTMSGSVQVLYALDEYDTIVGFYDEWTADQPDDYVRSEADTSVLFLLASPIHTINISNDYEERGNRYTILQVNAAGN